MAGFNYDEENKYYNPDMMGLDMEDGLFDDEEYTKKRALGLGAEGPDEAIDEEALLKLLGGEDEEPGLKNLKGEMSPAEKEYMMRGVPERYADDKLFDANEGPGPQDDFVLEGSEDLPQRSLFDADVENTFGDNEIGVDDSDSDLSALEKEFGEATPKTGYGKSSKESELPSDKKPGLGMGKPSMKSGGKPGAGKPGAGKPGAGKPGAGKPGVGKKYDDPFSSLDIKGQQSKGKPGEVPFKEYKKEKVELLPATEPSVEDDWLGNGLSDLLIGGGISGLGKLVGKAGLKGLLGGGGGGPTGPGSRTAKAALPWPRSAALKGAAEEGLSPTGPGGSAAKEALPMLRSNLNPSTAKDYTSGLWDKIGKMSKEAGGKESLPIQEAKSLGGKLKLRYPDATNITGAKSSDAAKRFGGFGQINRSDAMRSAQRITDQLKKPGGGDIESIRTQLRNLGLSRETVEEIIRSNMAAR